MKFHRLTSGDLMHLVHIFQDHEPHFTYTKGGKRKFQEKAKLVLKASQLYYQAMADKKDPAK